MAEKNRTNWSDKARRITGGITLIIIILIILLCVLLGKKTNKSAEPEATVQPVPVVTEVKEQEKKEEPVTVAKDSPVVEEKVDTKIEEPKVPVVEEPIIDIEVTDEPLYSSGEVSFEVCGITVQNSWSDGIFVSTSNAKERFLKDDVMAFVRYEADKYLSYMDKETVFKIIVSTGTIKIEYPSSIDPEILMPYYKNDIEEYASSIAPKEETIEEPIVKEVVEEKVAEVVPETADFTVFGYKVLNSWIPGTFTSLSETKGLLYESDIKGFAEYEIGKYGDFLLENVAIEYVEGGFVLTYPETVDPSAYISQYKSDIEEYVSTLFAPVEEVVEEPATEEVKVEEPVVEEPTVPTAPSAPVAVDVPKPAEVVEVVVSPKAEKLSSYKFKLGFGFGPEFGINNKVEYVTIFPRLSITADFQNVFTVSKFGFGARIDLTGVFKPLDGTFIGHEFKFFLNGNNWAVDAMIDAKLMAYANFDKVQLYVGGGIGYSIGSHSLYKYTHTSDVMIFGFDTAAALSAVVGLDWNINDKLTLTLEGNYRYFFQSSSKAQTFAATVGMGFMF